VIDPIEVRMHEAQLQPRYRPLLLPLPFPVVKKEPLRYYRPESLPMPTVKREPDLYPVFDLGQQVRMYAMGVAIIAVVMILLYFVLAAFDPDPGCSSDSLRPRGSASTSVSHGNSPRSSS
jgi:hypothetical protein